jgi:DNA-binding MarR family transcriptional regulator
VPSSPAIGVDSAIGRFIVARVQTLQESKSHVVATQLLALMTEVAKGSEPRALALAVELDLSLSQLRALLVLWRAETPMSLHALAEGVGLSDPAAVRMVDGLLRAGLVVRREDEHDRRVKRIALTAAGSQAVDQLTAARRESLERLAATLEPEELDRLIAALNPIVERLDLHLDARAAPA